MTFEFPNVIVCYYGLKIMEDKRCIICNKLDNVLSYSFVKVDSRCVTLSSNLITGVRNRRITERVIGVEDVCICDSCISVERNNSRWLIIFMCLIGCILSSILWFSLTDHILKYCLSSDISQRVRLCGVIFLYLVMIIVCIRTVVTRSDHYYATSIMSTLRGCQCINTDPQLYTRKGEARPDPELFRRSVSLRTKISDRIFECYIDNGPS